MNLIGATKGMGKLFAEICQKENWKTSIVARHSSDANTFCADVTILHDIQRVLQEINESHGTIDAAVFFQRWRGKTDSWRGHFQVSVEAIDAYLREIQRYMDLDPQRDKSIVVISSVSSFAVTSEQDAAYHASRTAQIGLVRYYAASLGKYGIRVNAVSFGNILKDTNRDFFLQNSGHQESFAKCSPLNRMGRSEEITAVIKFLVSPESSWITGQNLIVDGGTSLLWSESKVRENQ